MACEDQKQVAEAAYAALEASISTRDVKRADAAAANDAAAAAEADTTAKAEEYKAASDAYVACVVAS